MNASVALSYCGGEVRRQDPDRYLCTLFAPADRRDDLFALYAFNQEIARVREQVSQPMLGEIRLQWWRDGIAAAYEGTARNHPVLVALAGTIRRRDLRLEPFADLIDARSRDLDDSPMPDLKALEAYVAATSAGVVRLALAILDVRGTRADAVAYHVGVGFGLAGLLRAVPFHARSRRVMLPVNVMAAEALDAADVVRGQGGIALRRTVAAVAELARAHIAAARGLRQGLPRTAVPALLPASLAASDLDRLAAVAHDPFAGSLARPAAGRSIMLTLRALRGRF